MAEGGYRQILLIAFPLILSTGSWSLQHFVDRMFLAWYSPAALAASTPAGILNYTLMSLFIGTAGYVSTFVAQYIGAGRDERIGPTVWQGLYVVAGRGHRHGTASSRSPTRSSDSSDTIPRSSAVK